MIIIQYNTIPCGGHRLEYGKYSSVNLSSEDYRWFKMRSIKEKRPVTGEVVVVVVVVAAVVIGLLLLLQLKKSKGFPLQV
jgi:steroid 5-alpha reductase family enzyme